MRLHKVANNWNAYDGFNARYGSRVQEKSETIEMMVSFLRVYDLVRACCFGRKLSVGGKI